MGLKNDVFVYISIIAALFIIAFFSIEMFLYLVVVISLLMLPLIFSMRFAPKSVPPELKGMAIGKDIAQFRKIVAKALKENPVAQRDVELRLINALVVDISIKYGVAENEIRRNMENEKYLERFIGKYAKTAAEMYRRRHELRLKLPKDQFVKEVKEIMEAIG